MENVSRDNVDGVTLNRLRLRKNGFHPVPVAGLAVECEKPGKSCLLGNWVEVCATAAEDTVAGWARNRQWKNTGLLCGTALRPVLAFDVDILDEEIAKRVRDFAEKNLGKSLIRFGLSPKFMIVYRTDEAFGKISTPKFYRPDCDEVKFQVEVLGQGQHFVVLGEHPSGCMYRFEGPSVLDTAYEDLGHVRIDAVQTVLHQIEAIFRAEGLKSDDELGGIERAATRKAGYASKESVPVETLRAALAVIPSDNRGLWIKFGNVLHDHDDGLELWDEWSKKSKLYPGRDSIEKEWNTLGKRDPGGTKRFATAGAILADAYAHGWKAPSAKGNKQKLTAAIRELETHPTFSRVWFNSFSLQELLPDGKPVDKFAAVQARLFCEERKLYTATSSLMLEALSIITRRNERNALHEHLAKLPTWDGKLRLDTWLVTYLGAKVSPYVRAVGRMTLIALMARAYQPGCQVDYTLTLGGEPRKGKSTICRLIGGPFYRTVNTKVGELASHLEMGQAWVAEFNDTKGLNGVNGEIIKEFLQLTHDYYTPKYENQPRNVERHAVFIVTYNPREEGGWLKDRTALSRFWTVITHRIDRDAFDADRNQLLAEALAAYRNGEKWWPANYDDFLQIQRDAAADHDDICKVIDEWDSAVENFIQDAVERKWKFVTSGMFFDYMGIPISQRDRNNRARRIVALFRESGLTEHEGLRGMSGKQVKRGFLIPGLKHEETVKPDLDYWQDNASPYRKFKEIRLSKR